MRVLAGLHRFAESGEGDVKALPDEKSCASESVIIDCFLFQQIPKQLRSGESYIDARPTGSRLAAI
jgi:hypothetical protein